MIVVRKVLGTILWFIIFFVICIIGITIYALTQIDLTNEATVAAEAEAVGQALGYQYGDYMLYGSALLALLGSIFGVLPFTRHRRR